MKQVFLLIFVLVSLTACNSERKIDASTEDSMQKSIKLIMQRMDSDEQKEFEEALQIIMFGGIDNLMGLIAMGNNIEVAKGAFQAKVDGKTAKEILALAEGIKTANQKNNKEDKTPSTQAKRVPVGSNIFEEISENAHKKAHNKLLEETLQVSLESIKTISGDFGRKYSSVEIIFKNSSGKNIKGVKGTAVFKDIFGDTIKKARISSDAPIKADESFTYKGALEINQFISDDLKLSSTPKEKIQFSFEPDVILFEDDEHIANQED